MHSIPEAPFGGKAYRLPKKKKKHNAFFFFFLKSIRLFPSRIYEVAIDNALDYAPRAPHMPPIPLVPNGNVDDPACIQYVYIPRTKVFNATATGV